MTRTPFIRGLIVGAAALALVVLAAGPALAQTGSLRGKVVNAEGKGVDAAEVILDFVGDFNRQIKTLTDKNGEWIRAGMPATPGTWTITVKKGDLTGRLPGVRVRIGEMTRIDDIVIAAGTGAAPRVDPTLSAEEVKKRNERQVQLEKMFTEANAAIEAGNLSDAITKVTAIVTEEPSCIVCHAKLGDIYAKQGDLENAEKSYLKAIEMDPEKQGASYSALATIYNQQRRFDEATKMSEKANELLGAATGGDASQIYNQGIIYWNQSKPAEAQAQFERAIKLDPKLADAHYWLGMALVSQGKMAEAKTPLQEYLKLAPTGENAATAKALLDQIK